jgi:hypothetical protein
LPLRGSFHLVFAGSIGGFFGGRQQAADVATRDAEILPNPLRKRWLSRDGDSPTRMSETLSGLADIGDVVP